MSLVPSESAWAYHIQTTSFHQWNIAEYYFMTQWVYLQVWVAITKFPKLSGLQTAEIHFSQFWRLEVAWTTTLTPGTAQILTPDHPNPFHSLIIGDQILWMFFLSCRLAQVLKAPRNRKSSLCFHLIPGPLWTLVTFNKLCYLPYYIHISCLDASTWDTKNLGIFWSETTQVYNTITLKVRISTCEF
jgi:hypothetical protein